MANKTPPPPDVEPAIWAQLAQADDRPVEVVVTLRLPRSRGWDRARVEALANQLLEEVAVESNTHPERTNILANIGAIVIRAPAPFVKALTAHRLVGTIAANRHDPGQPT